MKVLIAEDGGVARKILETNLKKWGYEVIATPNGSQAWEVLNKDDAPNLAILDWLMPDMTGPEVCKKVRSSGTDRYTYIILVTARGQKDDIFEGFAAGADDYLTKPYDKQELFWRLRVGERILRLQSSLKSKSNKVDAVIRDFEALKELVPNCSRCDRVEEIAAFLMKLGTIFSLPYSADDKLESSPETGMNAADRDIKPLTRIIPETMPELDES